MSEPNSPRDLNDEEMVTPKHTDNAEEGNKEVG